ncbi:MAG: Serine/threonine protein kinase [Verrucomicrobia bacterium]|jgi:tRNA A-37 threonylcarbamoyl transferase component Bud32|nr:MAG: Serine/threonine protein kinase [Verrucomicrobiota bacterium]
MGAVYKARQLNLGRVVALKILSRSLADDPAFLERFEREARVLGRLNHTGIVTIFDSGTAGPFAYLLMEFVDGVNLRQAMQSGGFSPMDALAVTREICSALEFAHSQGILHRDIKPENILIDHSGHVKIADFGIAKLIGDHGNDHATLTTHGAILGSMHYMAPEQFDSPARIDHRADIYSLGVVLYELLTGELPIGRFKPPSEKSTADARIDEIVMRTLERERDARFKDVQQLKTHVDAATRPAPPSSPALPDRKTTRLASTALLCTALSLIIAALGAIPIYQIESIHQRGTPIPIAAFSLFLIAITAIPGTILALRALRILRTPDSHPAGLKRSIISALAWPAIVVALMLAFAIATAFADNAVGTVSRLLLVALLVVASGLGITTIAGLFRSMSARPPSAAPTRPRIWPFATAASLALICSAAYLLKVRSSNDTYLHPSGTRTAMDISLQPGTSFSYQLIRVSTDGHESPMNINGRIFAPPNSPLLASLVVLTTDRWKNNAHQQIEISHHSPVGSTGRKTIQLDEPWSFTSSGSAQLQLTQGLKERSELASRSNWYGKKLESLYLETVASPPPPDPAP